MRPFVENFPFFSIFLAILAAIVTAAIRSGRISYWITDMIPAAMTFAAIHATPCAIFVSLRLAGFVWSAVSSNSPM